MRINIVMGFFLPVPPVSGGATEKTWHRLAREFASRGHDVTVLSRRWPGWPDRETLDGVHHLRLPGADHRARLWKNLLLDALWSARAGRALPAADVTVSHAVTLPVWLRAFRPSAGPVVVMPGRMPKGQYRFYRGIARVIATSSPVHDRVLAEQPSLTPLTRIHGYPIDWRLLSATSRPSPGGPVTIGFVGRLHPEKGLDLLAAAAALLQADPSLPDWRLDLCGPDSVAAGGGGSAYRATLERKLRATLPDTRWRIHSPRYDEKLLAAFYGGLDIFCYPSLAASGETFGVAVAEAMAAGAAPVVSNLPCFRDFVRPDINGLVFNHTAPDASRQLAQALADLIRDHARRARLAAAARAEVSRYDFGRYADTLLADFATLT